MPACPDCGFDASTVTPPDAIVTIRSLPRRYRAALGSVPSDEDREAVLSTTPPGEDHSPISLVADVATTLAAHAGRGASSATSSDGALADLEAASDALAQHLDTIKGEEWLEVTDGTTPQSRARDAAHAGVHALRRLPDLVSAARTEARRER